MIALNRPIDTSLQQAEALRQSILKQPLKGEYKIMGMEVDTNPYRSLEAQITPTQFEIFCLETVKAYAEREGLKDFKINHDKKIETYDSTYQIDVFAEYTALGCNHKVIIECKHHAGNIKRALVTDLYTKMQSIGSSKRNPYINIRFSKRCCKICKSTWNCIMASL